jgi:hypothetical protein
MLYSATDFLTRECGFEACYKILILATLEKAGCKCLFCRFGDGCGGAIAKAASLTARGLQYVFSSKTGYPLGFLPMVRGVGEAQRLRCGLIRLALSNMENI